MSKRIDHIISVLENIRNGFNGSSNITKLRIKASSVVSLQTGVIRNTILDTITRQLEPEIASVEAFEDLTLKWLINNSSELKEIILKHCVDHGDEERINSFFQLNELQVLVKNEYDISFDELLKEGKKKLLIHFVKERNKELIKLAKRYWIKQNKTEGINCAICNFNFKTSFGGLGDGYIEAHHNVRFLPGIL